MWPSASFVSPHRHLGRSSPLVSTPALGPLVAAGLLTGTWAVRRRSPPHRHLGRSSSAPTPLLFLVVVALPPGAGSGPPPLPMMASPGSGSDGSVRVPAVVVVREVVEMVVVVVDSMRARSTASTPVCGPPLRRPVRPAVQRRRQWRRQLWWPRGGRMGGGGVAGPREAGFTVLPGPPGRPAHSATRRRRRPSAAA